MRRIHLSNNSTRGLRRTCPTKNCGTMMSRLKTRRYFSVVTVAALSTTTSQAWVIPTTQTLLLPSLRIPLPEEHEGTAHRVSSPITAFKRSHPNKIFRLYHSSPLRQRNRSNKEDDDDKESGGGLLGQLSKAVKSILPTQWFGSNEEKEKLARQQEQKQLVRNQVTGSLDELLKGAPLGIRMMGKMVAPLMGNLASTMAEGIAEQQRTTEVLLDDARRYMMSDLAITDVMGAPIQLETPFSQSSSMTSVNGKTQSRIELALNVSGPKRSGIARIFATESGISQLIVESGGKVMNVNLSSKGGRSKSSSGFGSGGSGGDDNIIEAEIIEKDTSKR